MIVMGTHSVQAGKEVIALDADDHLPRPTFIHLGFSDLRLLRIKPVQQKQVDRVQARDDLLVFHAV